MATQVNKNAKKDTKKNAKTTKKDAKKVAKKDAKTTGGGGAPWYHLLPFCVLVIISFVFFMPYKPSVATMPLERMVLKCLPILYLAVYLGYMDRWSGESGHVFWALLFSAVGDGFLAFHDQFFLYGLVAFAIAHILYAKTFGLKDRSLILGSVLYAFSFCVLSYLVLPNIQQMSFRIAMSVYGVILTTMWWRALDRYFFSSYPRHERRLCSVLGATSFVVSDSCYVFLQMLELLPHIQTQVIILSTYYLSQVLFMLGSCDRFWVAVKFRSQKKV